jgi:hypothetical protein
MEVARYLIEIFKTAGVPEVVKSDNEKILKSQLIKTGLERLGVTLTNTYPYRPNQKIIEVVIKELKSWMRLHRKNSETVEEVIHEEETGPVVGGGVVRRPIGQLQVGVLYVSIVETAHIVTVQERGQFGETLVKPGRFIAVLVPVNHVLEFMGKDIRVAIREIGVPRVDDKHLMRVGILMRLRRIFINGGEITSEGIAQIARVEDINVRVVIYAGSPFTAEEGSVGRINFVFEGLREGVQVILRKRNAILYPEIRVGRYRLKRGIYLKTPVRIYVGDPEFLMVARVVGTARNDARKSAKVVQAAGEIHQIVFRDDGFFQGLKNT